MTGSIAHPPRFRLGEIDVAQGLEQQPGASRYWRSPAIKWTLDDLATVAGVGPYHLVRSFARAYGVPPGGSRGGRG